MKLAAVFLFLCGCEQSKTIAQQTHEKERMNEMNAICRPERLFFRETMEHEEVENDNTREGETPWLFMFSEPKSVTTKYIVDGRLQKCLGKKERKTLRVSIKVTTCLFFLWLFSSPIILFDRRPTSRVPSR
jgi:hypothetical protein